MLVRADAPVIGTECEECRRKLHGMLLGDSE